MCEIFFLFSPITVHCRVAGDLLESEALTVIGAVGAVEDEIDFHMLLLGRAGLSQKGLCLELSDLHLPFSVFCVSWRVQFPL